MAAANRALREDRIIQHFTQSMYRERDFSGAVRNACKTGKVGEKKLKVIVVGSSSVGKTALVDRCCNRQFHSNTALTVGMDVHLERFCILGVPFTLEIWDTAGQEKHRCITASYYKNACVVVIVFDMKNANQNSWESVIGWHTEVMKHTCSCGKVHLFLVGTKKDLCTEQEIVDVNTRGIRLAEQINAEYWILSALTGEKVDDFFSRVACVAFNAAVGREVEDQEHRNPMHRERDLVDLNVDIAAERQRKCKC
ncbi:ras-related protein Rab-34-like [Patiria miniata]|uniref:Uncharacterized protein n=1 Tax=Patiria miniata TaxID=46514 RepID=A0A913ZQ25_PATMI|nr:ras-related protein Rab-34-like [Patiria miniata]